MARLLLLLLFVSLPVLADSRLDGKVSTESVQDAWVDLELAMEGSKATTITIRSPGGSMQAGLMMWKQIRKATKAGVVVTCVVEEEASSMAAILLQACSRRLIKEGSFLLFHNASETLEDSLTAADMSRAAADLAALSHRLAIYASFRMHISLKEYEACVSKADVYLSPQEAVELGAADAVIP